MRLSIGVMAVVALVLCAPAAHAEDAPSLELAREMVDARRGNAHAKLMRIEWPELEDEIPPEGAEVVLVGGYMSFRMTRLVYRGETVDAGSVSAAQSWFYNQDEGESFGATSFDVDPERFVLAWNAARRIGGAEDERLEPAPRDAMRRRHFGWGTHESVDWIRVRADRSAPALHCSDKPVSASYGDGVRRWDGLRDRAIFELFEALVPEDEADRREADVHDWNPFAESEIRDLAASPEPSELARDKDFIDTCLRVLGETGAVSALEGIEAFDAALATLDDEHPSAENLRERAARAAVRLRVRHEFDPAFVARALREAPRGTWSRGDQKKWLQRMFRETDPEAWAAFLVEEVTRADAEPAAVADAAADFGDVPRDEAIPLLRKLLDHTSPYVRLEAATTLHDLVPGDADAKTAVKTLALDRSIANDRRADLTNYWSRARALDAALEWGGLTRHELIKHIDAPKDDDPVFLQLARNHLAHAPAEDRD